MGLNTEKELQGVVYKSENVLFVTILKMIIQICILLIYQLKMDSIIALDVMHL